MRIKTQVVAWKLSETHYVPIHCTSHLMQNDKPGGCSTRDSTESGKRQPINGMKATPTLISAQNFFPPIMLHITN
jgi:hypothetical protein